MLVLAAGIPTIAPAADAIDVGASNSSWPMSGHNPAGTRWNRAATTIRPPLKELWSRAITNYFADGISVENGLIYLSGNDRVGSGGNKVVALTTDGQLQWTYSLFAGGVGAMGVTPAINAGVAYFGGQHDDRLYAVNDRFGSTLWTLPGIGEMYASPPIASNSIVYVFGLHSVRAVSASNGGIRWASAAEGWAGELALWDNTVVALSWYTPPTAFESATGRQLWQRKDLATYFSNVVAYEGVAYFGARGGRIYALDLADGHTIWSALLPQKSVFAEVEDYQVALANGILYVAGGVRATSRTPTPQNSLFALDMRTGTRLWDSDVAAQWYRPLVANGMVYVSRREQVSSAPSIVVVNGSTGKTVWQLQADGPVAIANERLYVLSNDGVGTSYVTALDTKYPSGTLNVTTTGPGRIISPVGGISCGTVCAGGSALGAVISLTAEPSAGATLLGWGGACAGFGKALTCTLVLSGDTNVSADFVPANSSAAYPVVFIHGINSSSETWGNLRDKVRYAGARYGGAPRVSTAGVVNTDVRVPFPTIVPADFYALNFTSNNALTFRQQGWELAKIIDEITRVNNSGKVVLVAHSMGGLAARAYLEGLARSQMGDVLPYRSDVAKLITIGTPHMGSPWPYLCQGVYFANIACAAVFGSGFSIGLDILKQDSPELTQLNSYARNLPPIEYVSVVITGKNLSAAGIDEDGDGVVAVSSQNLSSLGLPTSVSQIHRALHPIYIDPWCSGLLLLGSQSHTCETGNSSVQDSITRELQGSPLAGGALSTTNTIGISSTASGPISTQTLAVTIRPNLDTVGTAVKIFVAAELGQQFYFLTPDGWQVWTGGSIPAYGEMVSAIQTIQVLDGGTDTSALVGVRIYVGYGKSDSEMIASGRYTLVYTIR